MKYNVLVFLNKVLSDKNCHKYKKSAKFFKA